MSLRDTDLKFNQKGIRMKTALNRLNKAKGPVLGLALGAFLFQQMGKLYLEKVEVFGLDGTGELFQATGERC